MLLALLAFCLQAKLRKGLRTAKKILKGLEGRHKESGKDTVRRAEHVANWDWGKSLFACKQHAHIHASMLQWWQQHLECVYMCV